MWAVSAAAYSHGHGGIQDMTFFPEDKLDHSDVGRQRIVDTVPFLFFCFKGHGLPMAKIEP